MPIYEYKCQECKNIYEELHLGKCNSSNKIIFCSKCEKEIDMKKVVSLSSFKLEGRGWGKDGYVDTYKQTLDLI
jgi:putative FmdB family regulatory protein